MYERIINPIADYLAEISKIDKDSIVFQKLKFGVTVHVYNIWKTAVLLILCLSFNMFFEVLIVFICVAAIRSHAFGLHLNSSIGCLLFGLTTYLGSGYLCKIYDFTVAATIIIFIVSTFLFYQYAPSPTKNRPIYEKEVWRHKQKVFIAVGVAFIIALLFRGIVRNGIIYGVIISILYVLPITYKLFKEERGKYEKND